MTTTTNATSTTGGGGIGSIQAILDNNQLQQQLLTYYQ
jgi:hypothetical protein